MFARDVMTPGAEWIAPDLPLAEVGRIMRDKCIGCLPVGENDRLIGIITDRDLACRAVADGVDPNTTQARQAMTQGITWCFEDQSLDEIAQVMEQKQIHHLPVLNSQKRMVGIVSLSDLALRGTFGATEEVLVSPIESTAYACPGFCPCNDECQQAEVLLMFFMRPTPLQPKCRQRRRRHPNPCPARRPSLCRAVREIVPGPPRATPRHG
jgi:CBS domain-containing protein